MDRDKLHPDSPLLVITSKKVIAAFALMFVTNMVALVLAISFSNTAITSSHNSQEAIKVTNATAKRAARLAISQSNARKESRDQFCLSEERAYREKVKGIIETYKYFDSLKPGEASSTFNQFLLRLEPASEMQTRNAPPPKLCSEPGVGLSAKDIPKLPKHKDFSNLIIGNAN